MSTATLTPYYPSLAGAAGGVAFCLYQGQAVEASMGMLVCGIIGAASAMLLDIGYKSTGMTTLPSASDGSTGGLMMSAVYGFAGSYLVGMAGLRGSNF